MQVWNDMTVGKLNSHVGLGINKKETEFCTLK